MNITLLYRGSCLLMLSFIFISLRGQQQDFLYFDHVTTENGLKSINVRKITQDTKGFTWVGTQDGLYRFDGMHFDDYNKHGQARHSLTGSDIRDLLMAGDTLWSVNSYGGIDAINILTGNVVYQWDQQTDDAFKEVLFSSLALVGDSLFAGGDKQLLLINKQTRKRYPINIQLPFDARQALLQKILYDGQGHLWLFYANAGVCVLDARTLALIDYKAIPVNAFYDCTLTQTHAILAASSNGIQQFILSGSRIGLQDPFPGIRLLQTAVFAIHEDKAGNTWLSTGNELLRINPDHTSYSYINESKLLNNQRWTGSVFDIYFDNQDYLWLGCQQGLAFSNARPAQFLTYKKSLSSGDEINHTYFLFPADDSIVYACAEDGLYKVNQQSGRISTIDKNKSYFYAFRLFSGQIAVSGEHGTFLLQQGRLTPLSGVYPELKILDPVVLNSHIAIADSVYLLGTEDEKGIYRWNYKNKRITRITTTSSGARLKENIINTIKESRDGFVWILSDNSVMKYDFFSNRALPVDIFNSSNRKGYSIFFDVCETSRYYYIASYGNGIVVLDKQFRFIREISTANGLANNGVYKLFLYGDSLLLATTNNGLSVINLKTNRIRNYYESNGLHSSSFEELSGNIRKNIIYAGGESGFSIINPAYFSVNATAPPLYITNIKIETKTGVTDTSRLSPETVYIPNDVLQTTLRFSALNYADPQRTSFAYRIKEKAGNWISLGNQPTLQLIGLEPGTYTLLVKAANEDDIWSDPIELTLVFLPKWYQTWWFRLSLVLIFMGSMYALYRLRVTQLKKEQEIRSKLASDLHDDLGSTLNSVKVYANLALMEKDRDNHYVLKIKESIQEAIIGVRDMIWVLDNTKDSIEHLLSRVSQFASPLCEANGIRYKQEMSDEARAHKLTGAEKRNLYMILKEAVNNTCKYAEATELVLAVSLYRKRTTLQLQDNGKGFDSTAASEGNGLKNMKIRARQIKYEISIIASPGKGTSIYLQKS